MIAPILPQKPATTCHQHPVFRAQHNLRRAARFPPLLRRPSTNLYIPRHQLRNPYLLSPRALRSRTRPPRRPHAALMITHALLFTSIAPCISTGQVSMFYCSYTILLALLSDTPRISLRATAIRGIAWLRLSHEHRVLHKKIKDGFTADTGQRSALTSYMHDGVIGRL